MQDAYEFGVNWRDAKHAYELSRSHQVAYDKFIMENFRFSDYMDWRAEAEYCRMAWDLLDNALRPGLQGYEYRMANLEKLKGVIGEKAYNSRLMPAPTPGHLFE